MKKGNPDRAKSRKEAKEEKIGKEKRVDPKYRAAASDLHCTGGHL